MRSISRHADFVSASALRPHLKGQNLAQEWTLNQVQGDEVAT